MTVEILSQTIVLLRNVHLNDWNPNEQSKETFDELVKEIQEDGFGHPLDVVELPDHPVTKTTGEMQYLVCNGEHRYRAAKVLNMPEIPVYVHKNWTSKEVQMIKSVRRNLLTGNLNDEKFTRFIKELEDEKHMGYEEMYRVLGFDTIEEFRKHLIKDKEQKEESWIESLSSATSRESEAVDSLSEILNTIFKDAGKTLDKNYMFFSYKGQLHLLVLMDTDLFSTVNELVNHLRESDTNIADFMQRSIKDGLNTIKLITVDSDDEDGPVTESG